MKNAWGVKSAAELNNNTLVHKDNKLLIGRINLSVTLFGTSQKPTFSKRLSSRCMLPGSSLISLASPRTCVKIWV